MSRVDPLIPGAAIAGSSIASAAVVVGQSAVEDGLNGTTGWAVGVIVGGLAVWRFYWRQTVKSEQERATERREADAHKDGEIAALRAELSEVRNRYESLLRGEAPNDQR